MNLINALNSKLLPIKEKIRTSGAIQKLRLSPVYTTIYLRYKRLLLATGAVLILVILVGSVFKMIVGTINKPKEIPSPTPVGYIATPTPAEVANPSRYATDAGVLKMRDDANSLDTQLNSVDLRDDKLRPPEIEFGESF